MTKKNSLDINLNINLETNGSKQPTTLKLSNTKIETSMTVAQLAFLSRLFFEAGLFTNQNKSEALSAIAENFVTSNATSISLKSLKSKFYTVDPPTKESTKAFLEDLINSI